MTARRYYALDGIRGAGTPEHDSLPCGMGFGLSFRYQSSMVSIKRRLYLAAMYLLDFYFPFRFLRTAGKEKTEKRRYCRGFSCTPPGILHTSFLHTVSYIQI